MNPSPQKKGSRNSSVDVTIDKLEHWTLECNATLRKFSSSPWNTIAMKIIEAQRQKVQQIRSGDFFAFAQAGGIDRARAADANASTEGGIEKLARLAGVRRDFHTEARSVTIAEGILRMATELASSATQPSVQFPAECGSRLLSLAFAHARDTDIGFAPKLLVEDCKGSPVCASTFLSEKVLLRVSPDARQALNVKCFGVPSHCI